MYNTFSRYDDSIDGLVITSTISIILQCTHKNKQSKKISHFGVRITQSRDPPLFLFRPLYVPRGRNQTTSKTVF